jgi:hypothetical protein
MNTKPSRLKVITPIELAQYYQSTYSRSIKHFIGISGYQEYIEAIWNPYAQPVPFEREFGEAWTDRWERMFGVKPRLQAGHGNNRTERRYP